MYFASLIHRSFCRFYDIKVVLMARRKLFKFKLTKKQKRRFVTFLVLGLCVWAVFWLFSHPARKTPRTPFHRQTGRPKIAFVIDDVGNHNRCTAQLKSLGDRVTYAILPLLPYSRYYGNLSRQTGAEVILHLPLDTMQDKIPGRGLIVGTMSREDILDILARDLDSVPNYVGVNNHMGSRGTADREMMTVILKELKRRGLFFLDSYTTPESVVPSVGRKIGIPILARGVFLDNEDSKPAIRAQLNQLRSIAREKGNAIAIGHYRENTLEVLAKEMPRFKKEGFEIITLKEMLKVQQD
jgi:uncharacterized protein